MKNNLYIKNKLMFILKNKNKRCEIEKDLKIF